MNHWRTSLAWTPLLGLASVAPIAFPLAQMGYASLHDLALMAIIPAFVILLGVAVGSHFSGRREVSRVLLAGAMGGAMATAALEAVRYPGFLLGFMPGNLPELMGVLLLDQFAQGPSTASTIAGYAYHAWNGACFGILFAVLAQMGIVRKTPVWATAYGILIGVGFLASPVVESLGVGLFGVNFGWRFAATVLTAHAAFGLVLSFLLKYGDACSCESSSEALPETPRLRDAAAPPPR